jgi:hypothetical protein
MLATDLPPTPFTTATATQWGLSRKQLDTLVACHDVRRVLRGVYVRGDVDDTLQTRASAAALVLPPHTVACDRTAAWLLGVDVLAYRELEVLPPLETFALKHHNRPRRRGCAGGRRDLRADDIFELGGVRVTTPVRTAVDLACRLRRRDALAALDAFLRLHGLKVADLRREVLRHAGRRGVIQARELVALANALAESSGESWTRLEIIDRGLPWPELQFWVTHRGRPLFRIDLAYPRHKVAIEYDGRDFHEGDAFEEHDRKRREWLDAQGWTVIVVTKDDFSADAVDAWTNKLAEALSDRR